jgi:hypothetical protein
LKEQLQSAIIARRDIRAYEIIGLSGEHRRLLTSLGQYPLRARDLSAAIDGLRWPPSNVSESTTFTRECLVARLRSGAAGLFSFAQPITGYSTPRRPDRA